MLPGSGTGLHRSSYMDCERNISDPSPFRIRNLAREPLDLEGLKFSRLVGKDLPTYKRATGVVTIQVLDKDRCR
jgi:hypothetical protein